MNLHTRKQAIEHKCKECIYDPFPGNGTWREQVEACTSRNCPLYQFRPLTQATQDTLKLQRYEAMTPEQQVAYRKRQDVTRERFS